ncbi:evolutionarily conserved signaling intermediate in Toll pathway, mitochondrial [Cimex lectularius]|uniref:Evolutionarily conserved signaling intermediate in Toll pathway, mitochondrial n=1 Tax=Cimex lectularius TaxID=79782 RepID=A0A8I6RFJ8_CIMLE|nr:evolutionarily conserved signaling intermediate in Toll pathway, mitochondrial [Cimex lectularius]
MSRPLLQCILRKRALFFPTVCKFGRPSCETPLQEPTWSRVRRYSQDSKLVRLSDFEKAEQKDRDTYLEFIHIYKKKEIQRRGHVEFIYVALKHMKEFGVEKDLSAYKSLVDVFPKGKMVPRNMIQAEFMHYPKHQQCAIDLLEQMEENGVMPDYEMEDQLVNVFGKTGFPVRRYYRMMYWMPKIKNASPWPLPLEMTNDAYELAHIAINRIMSVDMNTAISTFKTSDVEGSLDDTWIVSAQSPEQSALLESLPENTPLYIDGRYRIWLRDKAVTYFVLRADICTKEQKTENYDDVSKLRNPFSMKQPQFPARTKTVHEQEDGMILAVCSTGTSSRDSLLCWVRFLEKTNLRLTQLPVVFTLRAPPEEMAIENSDKTTEQKKLENSRTDKENTP